MIRYEKDELLLLQVSLLKNTVMAFKESALPGSLYAIGSILSEYFDYVSDIDLVYIGLDERITLFKQNLRKIHHKTFDLVWVEPKDMKAALDADNKHFLFLKQLNINSKLLGGPALEIPQFIYTPDSYAKIVKPRIHDIHARISKRRLMNPSDGYFLKFATEEKEWVSFKDIISLYMAMGKYLLLKMDIDFESKWGLFHSLPQLKNDPLFKYFQLCHELFLTHGRYVAVTEFDQLARFMPLFDDLDDVISDSRFSI